MFFSYLESDFKNYIIFCFISNNAYKYEQTYPQNTIISYGKHIMHINFKFSFF